MPQTDSLGRATFHHIAPQSGVIPTDREVRWLKHLERHGPQNSLYLHELTRDTHRCKDTSLRQLQKLRAGGYLSLPPQQRQTAKADFNRYVYDISKAGEVHLRSLGLDEPTVRPDGHWWHAYLTACVTGSIDIAARHAGVRYIPTHDILAIRNAPLAIPLSGKRVIPDQLFALDYGGRFRAFALEVDRGTEPRHSPAARKSLTSSLQAYRILLERGLAQHHYGLRTPLLVLWIFTNRTRMGGFLELVAAEGRLMQKATLCQVVSEARVFSAPSDALFATPWQRADGSTVRIDLA